MSFLADEKGFKEPVGCDLLFLCVSFLSTSKFAAFVDGKYYATKKAQVIDLSRNFSVGAVDET